LFSVGTEPLLPLKDADGLGGGGPEDFKFDFLFLAGAAAFLEVGRRSDGDGEGVEAIFLAFFPLGAADRPRDTEIVLLAATSLRPIPSVLGPLETEHLVFF